MNPIVRKLGERALDAVDAACVRLNVHRTRFDFVDERHFAPIEDRAEAKVLFKDSIDMVEIETFSYCNRRCWFCPNAEHDRISDNFYMDEEIYLSILNQLAEIEYDGKISYSRYNEPLADRIILTRIAQARKALPKALLHTNTNGDYLKPEYLDELYDAGLRSINIQIYLGNRDRYDHERTRALMKRKVASLGLRSRLTVDRKDDRLEAKVYYKDMKARIYGRNFDVNGCTRGDTVPVQNHPVRTSPCLSPFYHVYIDYNGSLVPCCNVRSDIPQHADTVVGKLPEDGDLFAIYAGERAVGWRRSLVGFAAKEGICRTCSFVMFRESPSNVAVQARLSELSQAAQPAR
jgi:radical SAM family protein/iron-sulfur cluster protein